MSGRWELGLTGAGIALLAAVSVAQAQEWRVLRSAGRYGAFGVGTGNLTLECDSGCPGGSLGVNDVVLLFGSQLNSRLRFELGGHFQTHSDAYATSAVVAQAGLAAYLAGNLYVRGGATWAKVDAEDTLGTTVGSGGPGFTVGAGYELFIGRTTALTAYANYHAATLSALERSVGGNPAVTTGGQVSGVSFGVSIGRSPRRARCVAACYGGGVPAPAPTLAGSGGGGGEGLYLATLDAVFAPPTGAIRWSASSTTGSGGTRLDQLVGTGPGGERYVVNVTRTSAGTCALFLANILREPGSRMVSSPDYLPTGGWFRVVIEQQSNSAFLCLPLGSGILVTGVLAGSLGRSGIVTVRPVLFAIGQAAQRRWGYGTN